VSLGVEVNVLPAAVEQVRARGGLVIAQVNPRMPYTFGDAELDADLVDLALEVDDPLPVHAAAPLDDDAWLIGERVATRVPDGATLQAGIGAVPDAALAGLAARRGLRVWTEMFSDGVLGLEREGALDRDHPLTASFLFGSEELYRWVDGNERVVMRRTEVVNDPAVIARQPAMTSINTALQVDLFGQVNASRVGERIHSGFGGATDFLVGALHSHGGQALVALRSWHPRADVSTIVPLLDQPATSFQPTAVVTEHGVAPVWGHEERDQARALIELTAHPRVRDELREEARYLRLMKNDDAAE
jgi:acyl-CoA hydrolase